MVLKDVFGEGLNFGAVICFPMFDRFSARVLRLDCKFLRISFIFEVVSVVDPEPFCQGWYDVILEEN